MFSRHNSIKPVQTSSDPPAMKGLNMKKSFSSKAQKRSSSKLPSAETTRNPSNAWHWVPVLFPGLSVEQSQAVMEEVDSRSYTAPSWFRSRQPELKPGRNLEVEVGEPDRDPNNPLHWMPIPLPVISREN
jgi:hypothetical protein